MKNASPLKRSFDESANNKLNLINTSSLNAAKRSRLDEKSDDFDTILNNNSADIKQQFIAAGTTRSSATMLNESGAGGGGAASIARTSSNNGTAALHLLASGPLFGNLGSSSALTNGSATMAPTLPFSAPSTAESAMSLNGHHLAQHHMQQPNQMLAALAAVAASRNAAVISQQQQQQQPQPPQAEALQAILAHAVAASNGLAPFGYPPPGMRPGLVGPMPPNFLFDGSANYHPYAMEAGRRKNATREVTQPLKVWLEQHHKNPYPTKAEKTVLAIITKMNLTQVSTWFANARRRLKKDNKMTWSPRNNRNADDEDDDVGSERPSSPLSNLSDDGKRDSLDTSLDSGNPNCQMGHGGSDAFLFGSKHHHQQQQQIDGQKKIWSIEDTLNVQPQHQRTAMKTPSTCSSTEELKLEHKADISSSSESSATLTHSSQTLANMTAAFMAQGGEAAAAAGFAALSGGDAPATAATSSPNSAGDAQPAERKPPFPFQMPLNPATIAALNSFAQQQHNNNLQQQQHASQQHQQMIMNPLFAFLAQNQRQIQTQQQQQQLLFMVAAAAAAAAKNPQQQQQQQHLVLNGQQQQQLATPSLAGASECGTSNSDSVSPSCSVDAYATAGTLAGAGNVRQALNAPITTNERPDGVECQDGGEGAESRHLPAEPQGSPNTADGERFRAQAGADAGRDAEALHSPEAV